MRRILRAFALSHPHIGYCQSLNFLTGMLLLFLDEEEAYWLLVTIVTTLLPPDYYSKSMVGVYVDQYVLASLVETHLPRVHKYHFLVLVLFLLFSLLSFILCFFPC